MRVSWLGPSSAVAVVCACSFAACSATNPLAFTEAAAGNGGASSSSAANGGAQGAGASGNGGTSTGIVFDAGMVTSTGTGTATTLYAYAHTNYTLFQLDPSKANLALTKIGDFDCLGGNGQDTSMTDLAVNEAGDVWAVSTHNFYKLALPAQPGPVHCATIQPLKGAPSGDSFYGLTFAPVGTVDPSAEVLVGSDTSGALWAIDTTTGQVTQHGTFGPVPANDGHGHDYQYAGKEWELSGDIVFVGMPPVGFATVRDCPNPPSSTGCNTIDTLIEIDTTKLAAGTQIVTKSVRGQVVKSATCTDPNNAGYGSMYGIAAYQADVYGFSRQSSTQGSIVKINNTDGTACLVLSTPGDGWAGAAISTLAPVVPPSTN